MLPAGRNMQEKLASEQPGRLRKQKKKNYREGESRRAKLAPGLSNFFKICRGVRPQQKL